MRGPVGNGNGGTRDLWAGFSGIGDRSAAQRPQPFPAAPRARAECVSWYGAWFARWHEQAFPLGEGAPTSHLSTVPCWRRSYSYGGRQDFSHPKAAEQILATRPNPGDPCEPPSPRRCPTDAQQLVNTCPSVAREAKIRPRVGKCWSILPMRRPNSAHSWPTSPNSCRCWPTSPNNCRDSPRLGWLWPNHGRYRLNLAQICGL